MDTEETRQKLKYALESMDAAVPFLRKYIQDVDTNKAVMSRMNY